MKGPAESGQICSLDDVFLIQRELAEAYKAGGTPSTTGTSGATGTSTTTGTSVTTGTSAPTGSSGATGVPSSIPRLVWSGDVPHQKWMNFYTKVLSKFRRNRWPEAHASSGGRPFGRDLVPEGR
jgi:hypothetical protein